jgi:eukaryotic-like serine/threonine-protein kinase
MGIGMPLDSGETTLARSIGRYRVFGELGRGAMGVVYRGFDPVIGRTVALKTLSVDPGHDLAKEYRDRLYREAAAAGALSHPNIVTIFDIVEDGAVTAVAMEFIEGRPLAAIIAERAPLPLDAAVDILDQVCSALDFAGSQGIVHRDIKPANILLTSGGRVKVTDFGVARLALSTMTQAGTVLGSPSYMSPEQVRGLSLDGRSDLFSAAVVFYEMITRERPFAGSDIATTMYRIAHEPPTPPGQFNAAIGSEIAFVLDRAFAKYPADRFQTGADFVSELRAVAALDSRRGESAVLAALASAPPPVPTVVAPQADNAGTALASPGPLRPAMPPIPVSGSPTPAVLNGDSRTLAPIPGMGAEMPVSSSEADRPLPAIPLPSPLREPAGAPRSLVTPGKKPSPSRASWLASAAVAVAAVAAVAAVLWYLGGTGSSLDQPAVPAPAVGMSAEVAVREAKPVPAPARSATAPAAALPAASIPARPDVSVPGPVAPSPRGPATSPARPGARTAAQAAAPASVAAAEPLTPPAPAAPPAIARSPGRGYRATDVDTRPTVLAQVPPRYPEDAARQNVQDVVVLEVLVGPAGSPEEVRVLRGSRKASSLDGAAVAAVRQWKFSPALKDGKPVSCWFAVGVPFAPPR